MEAQGIVFLQLGFWAIMLIILIVLLFRRLRIRDKESFEKRDN